METPSVNTSNPLYFRLSELISRLRATVQTVDWRSPRTAISLDESETKPRELVCARGRETGLPGVWRLRRHLRSRLLIIAR